MTCASPSICQSARHASADAGGRRGKAGVRRDLPEREVGDDHATRSGAVRRRQQRAELGGRERMHRRHSGRTVGGQGSRRCRRHRSREQRHTEGQGNEQGQRGECWGEAAEARRPPARHMRQPVVDGDGRAGRSDATVTGPCGRPPVRGIGRTPCRRLRYLALDRAHAPREPLEQLVVGLVHRSSSGWARSAASARATSERTPDGVSLMIAPISSSDRSPR